MYGPIVVGACSPEKGLIQTLWAKSLVTFKFYQSRCAVMSQYCVQLQQSALKPSTSVVKFPIDNGGHIRVRKAVKR